MSTPSPIHDMLKKVLFVGEALVGNDAIDQARPAKPSTSQLSRERIRADFWEGDATKHLSVKKGVFSKKGGAIQ